MVYGKIYKITLKESGKSYIGQTTKSVIMDRIVEHKKDTRNNRHISNAIRKYGIDSFTIEEIATAKDQDELNQLEVKYVQEFNTLHPNGYNHRAGGKQNGICSDELKKKISQAKLGKPNLKRRGEPRSKEYREKISRGLGGKLIKATHIETGNSFILQTAREGRNYGFNPSNIVQICKKTNPSRTHSKGYKFEYIDVSQYANQIGSVELKSSSHEQRLVVEPAKAD